MNTYNDLSMGLAGVFVFVASQVKRDYADKKNDLLALSTFIVLAVLLTLGIQDEFASLSSASSSNLFGFIGRILCLIGCMRLLCLRFPDWFK